MADSSLIYMALQRLPELGPKREARLFQHFTNLESLFSAGPTAWRAQGLPAATVMALQELGLKQERSAWVEQVKADHQRCCEQGWHLITLESADYPPMLRQIHLAPPLLYAWGDHDVLQLEQVAMVGSRKASGGGVRTAQLLARELAGAGVCVTSGLALGIDSASHHAALEAGGKTIAVLGSGLANLYPRRNQALASAIAAQGCVVSEFWPDAPPRPEHFPQRNRIISGLCDAVIVVEAAERSGSLITARYAIEQNRSVFALPGSINNPLSKGCNTLIQQGAQLLNSAEELLAELNVASSICRSATRVPAASEPPVERLAEVLYQVDFEDTPIDTIISASGQTPQAVLAALSELVLLGRVEQSAGGFCRLK